ncbi:helix-loop-helix protein delilah-like [Adelges cooleyi]|uniref:helix-loop-helix protein delilah-like n=1 Tax=Adelges cooleyi TaxID=133065 RepID=UPI00217F904A|nr:helix-loop-helix protein delilah-like [Adelges cooleyi]
MTEFDANNNSAVVPLQEKSIMVQEKYSLRPRASLKREEPDEENEEASWKPSGRGRSAKRRQKPKPLSRYRRKTANARERSRMREINEAFEALRRAVPHLAVEAHNEKLTKITTLRLAMKYISALSGLLSAQPSPATLAATSPSESDVDSLLSEYAPDLLSECSVSTPPGSSSGGGGGGSGSGGGCFLDPVFRDMSTYSLSPSSCSTDVGFPSLLAADFPDASSFMPFADHALPPIDFNGDPYMFEDNFATEFS